MRRVLVVSPYFPPSRFVGAQRAGRFARMLPEFGWTAVVIAGAEPDAGEPPEWTQRVEVVRVPGAATETPAQNPTAGGATHAPAGKPSLPSRLYHGARNIARNVWQLLNDTPDKHVAWSRAARRRALELARKHPVDAILTTGPPHSMQLVGRHLKQQLGVPWIADFRDPWARQPWGKRAANPWGQALIPRFERQCIAAADMVVLNTDTMCDDFRQAYPELPASHFCAIANGCDEIQAEAVGRLLAQHPPTRTEGKHDSQQLIRLLHPGSLYHGRDPRPIAEAVAIVRNRGWNVRFEQIGHVTAFVQFPQFIAERNYQDLVTVSPPVPQPEVHARMAETELLLLVQPGTPLQVPAKLYEMLLFEKPILAVTDTGATADIIHRYGLGLVVGGSDPEAIANALEQLIQRRDEIARSPGWAQSRRDFDGRHLTSLLAQALDKISEGRPPAGG